LVQLPERSWLLALAAGANLIGIGLFVSRVRAPATTRWFGYGTQRFGLPALGLVDRSAGMTDLSTCADLGHAAWAPSAAAIDGEIGFMPTGSVGSCRRDARRNPVGSKPVLSRTVAGDP